MKRTAFAFAVLLCCVAASTSDPPKRPRIFGIARIRILTTNLPAAHTFYSKVLGPPQDYCQACDLSFPAKAYIQIFSEPPGTPIPSNLIDEIAFATDDIEAMRTYLRAHGVSLINGHDTSDGYLVVPDPEGHHISFAQIPLRAPFRLLRYPAQPSSMSLIHVGIVVHDRAAEDHFYKDILGFRLYWQGGFKDDQTDWVEMQVPDGTDWIEYMLNIPANADKKELGVQNHFSLGVKSANAAAAQLRARGLKSFDGPEIGRDGKNSLDAYDPDGTRVEIMEFTPAQTPCCHPYTAPHPKP